MRKDIPSAYVHIPDRSTSGGGDRQEMNVHFLKDQAGIDENEVIFTSSGGIERQMEPFSLVPVHS